MSTITMSEILDRLEAATGKVETDQDLLAKFVHGAEGATVPMPEGDPLPCLRTIFKDLNDSKLDKRFIASGSILDIEPFGEFADDVFGFEMPVHARLDAGFPEALMNVRTAPTEQVDVYLNIGGESLYYIILPGEKRVEYVYGGEVEMIVPKGFYVNVRIATKTNGARGLMITLPMQPIDALPGRSGDGTPGNPKIVGDYVPGQEANVPPRPPTP